MDYTKLKKLEFRRKFLRIFGAEIDITDPESNQLVGFIEMKAWKLKEDIRIYNDKSKDQELLRIHARSIIDFGTTYDVFDSQTNEQVFSMRRKGLKSTFLRDHWDVNDPSDQPLAILQETSSALALVRRYVDIVPFVGWAIDMALSFAPLTYKITDISGNTSAQLVHRKNPFIVKISMDATDGTSKLDPRVNIALTAMLSVIDASKN